MTREEWGDQQTKCWLCSKTAKEVFPPILTTHEAVRGVHRKKGIKLPACWIRCCTACHGVVEGWGLARQYALKAIMDGEYYDRVACNRARCRSDDSVSEKDVIVEISWVLKNIRS